MRWIVKSDRPPEAIRIFLEENLPIAVNLDYDSGFNRKKELRQELVEEQGGLCGYTGVAIDERLSSRSPIEDGLRFSALNEHLKPQSICRQELRSRGLEPSRDLGEDLDPRNLIAALEVKGAKGARREIFGAAARPANTLLPVLPTQPDCETRFRYLPDGRIEGRDPEACTTISMLRLNHTTLTGWRSAAWDVFSEMYLATTNLDLAARLRSALSEMHGKRLPEFGFVIESVLVELEGRRPPAGREDP